MKEFLEDKKILLIGEVHGTTANCTVLEHFYSLCAQDYPRITVALEISEGVGELLDELVKNNATDLPLELERSEVAESGRISKQHLHVIQRLAKQGASFAYVREDLNGWNETDKEMARRIRELSQECDLVVACLGNMHTQKSTFLSTWTEGKYVCNPVGKLLSDESKSVLVRYCDTGYYNFGKVGHISDWECGNKKLLELTNCSREEAPHDYEIFVSEGHPVKT